MELDLFDQICCDRIETLIARAHEIYKTDPELADYILLEARHFAESVDEVIIRGSGILWCEQLRQ